MLSYSPLCRGVTQTNDYKHLQESINLRSENQAINYHLQPHLNASHLKELLKERKEVHSTLTKTDLSICASMGGPGGA
jgi:hypothetical protein